MSWLKIADPPPAKLGTIYSLLLATIVPFCPPPNAKLGITTGFDPLGAPPTPLLISFCSAPTGKYPPAALFALPTEPDRATGLAIPAEIALI